MLSLQRNAIRFARILLFGRRISVVNQVQGSYQNLISFVWDDEKQKNFIRYAKHYKKMGLEECDKERTTK